MPTTVCKHHWLLEPQPGRTSKGVCKLCGITSKEAGRVFYNVYDVPFHFGNKVQRGKGKKPKEA